MGGRILAGCKICILQKFSGDFAINFQGENIGDIRANCPFAIELWKTGQTPDAIVERTEAREYNHIAYLILVNEILRQYSKSQAILHAGKNDKEGKKQCKNPTNWRSQPTKSTLII